MACRIIDVNGCTRLLLREGSYLAYRARSAGSCKGAAAGTVPAGAAHRDAHRVCRIHQVAKSAALVTKRSGAWLSSGLPG